MLDSLPPLVKNKLIDQSGYLTVYWQNWITLLYTFLQSIDGGTA